MSYVDAISNALAARGNALAQGELQRGQVWGNLARNLGEIPGQAIAFHQQREAAMQNNELKKIAIEKAQRTADREKRAIQIVNSGKPKDQIYAELKMLASEDPQDFLDFQKTESDLADKNRQFELEKAGKEFTMRSGLPGTEVNQGEWALPMPTTGQTTSRFGALGTGPVVQPGLGNAFEQPRTEAQQLVHPINKLGIRPPTDVDLRERKAADDALAMKKYGEQQAILERDRENLERLTQEGRKEIVQNRPQPVTPYRDWKLQNPQGTVEQWLASQPLAPVVLGQGSEGTLKVFRPTKGGKGTTADVPISGDGTITPKVTPNLSDSAIKEITQSESAIRLLDELGPLITENKQYIGPVAGTLTTLNPYSKGRQVASDIARVRQRIGKALEGGVLRKEDEEKYKTILANIQDTDENALYKIEALKADIKADVETYKKNMGAAGRNMSNFPASPAAGGAPIGFAGYTAEDEAKLQALEKAAAEKKKKLGAKK